MATNRSRTPRPTTPDAPASLLATLGTQRVEKAQRVFKLAQYPDTFQVGEDTHAHPRAGQDIMPRTLCPDGRLASVECEVRADGTHGAPMYALTRITDGRESTVRASFADLSAFASAAASHGLAIA